MPDSPDVAYLKPFIESTNDAAARFRRVLFVMVTASILGFGAVWNSMPFGWLTSRLTATRNAEKYLTLQELRSEWARLERPESDEKAKAGDSEVESIAQKRERVVAKVNHTLRVDGEEHGWLTDLKELNKKLNSPSFDQAREWTSIRNFHDSSQAIRYAQSLDDMRNANVLLVRIPFFGIGFDVNDLGLLEGITFSVILILFRFTLWREYNNLRLTFRLAKPEDLRYCYLCLAMQQVLTVPPIAASNDLWESSPPISSESRVPKKPSGRTVRLLYFTPLFVQVIIIISNGYTMQRGWVIHNKMTIFSFCSSILLFLFMLLWTSKCRRLSISIDKEWEKRAPEAIGAS
jgi:hypothetical protein